MPSRRKFVNSLIASGAALMFRPVTGNTATQSRSEIVASFRDYLTSHLASYKNNRRQHVSFGRGWMNGYYEPDGETSIDVQTTTSLVTPYLASGEFSLRVYVTAPHKTKEDAAADSNYVNSSVTKHRHTYAYQDGKWIPKTRKNLLYGEWYDCNEIISSGENKGATNICGCWEEIS